MEIGVWIPHMRFAENRNNNKNWMEAEKEDGKKPHSYTAWSSKKNMPNDEWNKRKWQPRDITTK